MKLKQVKVDESLFMALKNGQFIFTYLVIAWNLLLF